MFFDARQVERTAAESNQAISFFSSARSLAVDRVDKETKLGLEFPKSAHAAGEGAATRSIAMVLRLEALAHTLLAMALTTDERAYDKEILDTTKDIIIDELSLLPLASAHQCQASPLILAGRQIKLAMALEPCNVDVICARADFRRACGNMTGALRDLKRASAQEPALLEVEITRALIFINHMRDLKSAVDAAEEAYVAHRVTSHSL